MGIGTASVPLLLLLGEALAGSSLEGMEKQFIAVPRACIGGSSELCLNGFGRLGFGSSTPCNNELKG